MPQMIEVSLTWSLEAKLLLLKVTQVSCALFVLKREDEVNMFYSRGEEG